MPEAAGSSLAAALKRDRPNFGVASQNFVARGHNELGDLWRDGRAPDWLRPYLRLARLDRPIDFESLDGQPVDLIFLLLAPEAAGADHLKALARVARLLRDADVVRKLRDSQDAEALYAVLAMQSSQAA